MGLDVPSIDPLTGLVLDSRPNLRVERTGLEELDIKEIRRHRYDGQYPGEPSSHFLGGSNDITFGSLDTRGAESQSQETDEVGTFFEEGVSSSWQRLRDHATSSERQKAWREAYHQMAFIADRLDLPDPAREDVCRAYANLRDRGLSRAYSLEKLLGLLAYVACKIHGYPRDFDDIEEGIDELYGLTINRSDVTRDIVRAFNKGPIRFGFKKQNERKYLRTWKMIHGKQKDDHTLGRI
ncbi:hypothetical protein AKJ41_05680 [candidate division MSBL1 archaeon SCGC-AAA259O05]|uniref:Uncharacterized protein n=1 Tax=candidate division MSBL1 archaeon SCGC-AAA259O05 TaxID=1698271 RepID=A0A133UYL8_9EURY|nr:hypothetical protein AKJ41_05680 [candidate division MSBL1 archaeon SCGC-AAA259O05]